jgi:hypothetical protein
MDCRSKVLKITKLGKRQNALSAQVGFRVGLATSMEKTE